MTLTPVAGHSDLVVFVAAIVLASAVEMVEALTIVLAAGTTLGWRPALRGAGAAVVALGALVAAAGPTLIHYVPLAALRVVVGAMLLSFGLQWLRKALLRAAGVMAQRDEDALFEAEVKALATENAGHSSSTAFTVAFKGVFLEGLEVVVIVVTLGTSSGRLTIAALAAASTVAAVAVIGAVVARQLSAVPENLMKLVVGMMLVAYGTFWTGEGVGARWPGGDVAIVVILGAVALWSAALVSLLRRRSEDDVIAS